MLRGAAPEEWEQPARAERLHGCRYHEVAMSVKTPFHGLVNGEREREGGRERERETERVTEKV